MYYNVANDIEGQVQPVEKLTHWEYLARTTDLAIERKLKKQILNPESPLCGGAELPGQGFWDGENGTGLVRLFLTGYYLEGSVHYLDPLLLDRADLAIDFVLRRQKADGTFDLKTTNLHDGAQTSFHMTTLGPAALLMRAKSRHTAKEEAVCQKLLRLIDRCGDGMVAGGFHTPNHRWVMASGLAMVYRLTGRQDCLDKMQLLLNEGIDQDEDGEFTEHSGGVYNIVCDRAFILLAFALDRPEFYDIVTKNLRMVCRYIEPDLTVNTMNSSRQDAGTSPDWRKYYDLYLFMALKTKDAQFRFIADRMLEQSYSSVSRAGQCAGSEAVPGYEYLPLMMMDASLREEWTEEETREPDLNGTRLFASGVLRHRKDDFTLTLVKNNPDFMLLKRGRHSALIRLCGTFYAQGQFTAEDLTPTAEGWHMVYRRRWGYKSPLPERQETSDWRKMDHSKRSDVMMQDFVFHVDVRLLDKGARIRVRTEGVECVMTKLEILLEAGGEYIVGDDTGSEYAGGILLRSKKGDYLLQSASNAKYVYEDGSALLIEGGYTQDSYAEYMRGSLPADANRFTVAMTAETPMDRTVTLQFID